MSMNRVFWQESKEAQWETIGSAKNLRWITTDYRLTAPHFHPDSLMFLNSFIDK